MLSVARATLPVAVALFFVAVVIGAKAAFILLVPAGILFMLRGILMLTYRDEVLRPLAEAETKGFKGALGFRSEHPAGAGLLLLIGAGWIAFGLVACVVDLGLTKANPS
jgi:hypothetical protein